VASRKSRKKGGAFRSPLVTRHSSLASRLMLLCSTTGYQTRAFVEAARAEGIEVVFGSDRCHVLEDPWRDGALPLRFEDPQQSAVEIAEYASQSALDAIVALGDRPAPTAARACSLLGLRGHPPQAADLCRDKYESRKRLRDAGLKIPRFIRFPLESNPEAAAARAAGTVGFPCVLKPLALSASRGVIRANSLEEFAGNFERIRNLLRSAEVQVMREVTSGFIQAEEYIEGAEIAVEGLVIRGETKILAIFDKPDALAGPFFEETIYVTPTRLPLELRRQAEQMIARAIKALNLFHGPFHAELRINAQGVWPLELAARSIGGLCSRALRFHLGASPETISLERLIIKLALSGDVSPARREEPASGVMMIPVEAEGIYEEVEGVERALATPGVEEVIITARPGQHLIPWPEGCSYPGFIFARGPTPQTVEDALRAAHRQLSFRVAAALPVIPG
jgi:biotin carboxylase